MSDLLTISEVAELLNVGEDTVTRRFAKVRGVIDLGSPETPKRRRYRVLRIPKTVVERFLILASCRTMTSSLGGTFNTLLFEGF